MLSSDLNVLSWTRDMEKALKKVDRAIVKSGTLMPFKDIFLLSEMSQNFGVKGYLFSPSHGY